MYVRSDNERNLAITSLWKRLLMFMYDSQTRISVVIFSY